MSTPDPVHFRRALLQDAPALARMRWEGAAESGTPPDQTYGQFEAAFTDFLAQAISEHSLSVWVAESQGRLVAHVYVQVAGAVPRPGRFGRRWGHVSAVYTTPEARNHGIGSGLFQRVIEWSAAEGLEYLLLESNGRSRALYERAGFRPNPELMELDLESDH